MTIGRENKKGKVLYVNSIEDPWAGVSVLPLNKPQELWYVDKMGDTRFLQQGLDGETDKVSGTKSILF